MFKRILLPVDGSLSMAPLVHRCLAFAAGIGAHVVAIHVLPPQPAGADTGLAHDNPDDPARAGAATAHAARILQEVADAARALGVQCDSTVVAGAQPWEAIVQAALDQHADLICMGSHGRHATAENVLGSQAAHVLEHTRLPVLVYR